MVKLKINLSVNVLIERRLLNDIRLYIITKHNHQYLFRGYNRNRNQVVGLNASLARRSNEILAHWIFGDTVLNVKTR